MKKIIGIVLGATVILATSCSKETEAPTVKVNKAVYIVNGGAETIDIYNVETGELDTNIITTGTTPNVLKKFGEYFYLVNSGFGGIPMIQKIDYHDNTVVDSFILPVGSNPWDIAWDGSNFYVTSYTFDRVYKLNSSGDIIDSADAGVSPEGVLFFNGKLFVMATFYHRSTYQPDTGYLYEYTPDLAKIDSVKLFVNPTLIVTDSEYLYVAGGDYVNGGNIYKITPDSLFIIDSLSLDGTPGAFVVKNGKGYLTGYSYFPTVVDLSTLSVIATYTDAPANIGFMGIDVNSDASKIYVSVASWQQQNYLWIISTDSGDTSSVELGNGKGSQIVKYMEIEE